MSRHRQVQDLGRASDIALLWTSSCRRSNKALLALFYKGAALLKALHLHMITLGIKFPYVNLAEKTTPKP